MNCPNCQQQLEDMREVDDRVDFWCNHCHKGFSSKQLSEKSCSRCGKVNVDIHTCTPNDSYKRGYEEGYYTALKESNDRLEEALKLLRK